MLLGGSRRSIDPAKHLILPDVTAYPVDLRRKTQERLQRFGWLFRAHRQLKRVRCRLR